MANEANSPAPVSERRFHLTPSDISRARSLVGKYAGAGPRYTSYPTAVEFTPEFGPVEWEEHVRQDSALWSSDLNATASLYFHIPFCRELCYFCACNKVVTHDHSVTEPYLKALERELQLYRRALGEKMLPVEQLHRGGGSPNYLSAEQIRRLVRSIAVAFPQIDREGDISIELDPRTTTPEQVVALRESGFNRVSLGVQDFDSRVQEAVHRIQPFEMTRDLVERCRAHGFGGVNIDLIYGLSFQTVESFSRTIDRVLEIRPDRVALYGYAHVTWLQKVQKTLERGDLPAPEERIRIFFTALEKFVAAGYEYIGLDHFALPHDELSTALANGKLNRNFMGYTTHRGARLYGFGASAISSLPQAYAQSVKDVREYQDCVGRGVFPTERGVRKSADDTIRGDVIEAILCKGQLSYEEFECQAKSRFEHYFADQSESLEDLELDGLIVRNPDGLQLTPLGRIFARNVAMLFDAYLRKHRQSEKRVFSQTV